MGMSAEIPNPFVYGQVLLPGRPFCARPALEQQVLAAAEQHGRLVLLGERRMGKSSLVEHTLGTGHVLLSIDLRGLVSVEDFIDRLLLKLETALIEHKPVTKHLPGPFKEALAHLSEVKVSLHGIVELTAKPKAKASTVMRALETLNRASRWRPLVIFFDEFQEVIEGLPERESQHLLGVLRAEIQRHPRIAYVFAGSARSTLLDLFTSERSHFYQTAIPLEVGPIPREDMTRFLTQQFARGGRDLTHETLHAIFELAGESPNDQQQLAYHLWTQSTPGEIAMADLQRAIAFLMAEVGRRAELILAEATPAQRKLLFAVAVRGNQETATDEFRRFAGFGTNSSVSAAMRPFLTGNHAILEKRGSRVRYREQFFRLWMTLKLRQTPSLFPSATPLLQTGENALFVPYLLEALKS
jgi:uncharacterized protein